MILVLYAIVLFTMPLNVCTVPKIEYKPGTYADTELDTAHLKSGQVGCVKYYGSGSCLVRLIKSGERSYQAVCRRGVSQ